VRHTIGSCIVFAALGATVLSAQCPHGGTGVASDERRQSSQAPSAQASASAVHQFLNPSKCSNRCFWFPLETSSRSRRVPRGAVGGAAGLRPRTRRFGTLVLVHAVELPRQLESGYHGGLIRALLRNLQGSPRFAGSGDAADGLPALALGGASFKVQQGDPEGVDYWPCGPSAVTPDNVSVAGVEDVAASLAVPEFRCNRDRT